MGRGAESAKETFYMSVDKDQRWIVGVTGASGVRYALRLCLESNPVIMPMKPNLFAACKVLEAPENVPLFEQRTFLVKKL